MLVDADGVEERALSAEQVARLGAQDPLRLRALCAETVDAGHSVLLFCGAKKAPSPRPAIPPSTGTQIRVRQSSRSDSLFLHYHYLHIHYACTPLKTCLLRSD